MAATLDGLVLPESMAWPNRLQWTEHLEAVGRSIDGLLYAVTSQRTLGRPIRLQTVSVGDRVAGHMPYVDARAGYASVSNLLPLWDRVPQTMTLLVAGETHYVRWDKAAGGFQFELLDPQPALEELPSNLWYAVALNFYTVSN